ncbi:OLC1v1005573C1 [Oldenlandia corymbosa var. corymbosa]|uniref:OLC1v1005573C1 n=1 Tax=Oldenlandia corymbosa var. corymbosa TaxID=529605 RepID=A0AAV1DEX7_OLDCO|nr:OLC1v1005573C1 [Oldenlandia corymbosa var. corymbosa]
MIDPAMRRRVSHWTRTFLRQRIVAKLAALLLENKEYSEALAPWSELIKEVRRLGNKLHFVEIHVLKSKLHVCLTDHHAAKAAFIASRTAENAIYVLPADQGTIDLQSGIVHAEEKDYKTAYSYFYEAFEALNALGYPQFMFSPKYMWLCQIMVRQADDGTVRRRSGCPQEPSYLYHTLLEQNLCRFNEPFLRIEIAAELIGLPAADHVEKKLSQMILESG